MGIDESIVQLGAKLDAWWDEFSPMLDSKDRSAQGKVLLRGFELAKEFDHLKADGLAAITALLNRHDATTEVERVASLVQAFAFAAKLAGTLHDEFRDMDGKTECARVMYNIANALHSIGAGQAALAGLLDDPDAGVRASAGVYLIEAMPERVVPILREIEEKEAANSAHITAYFALLRWEHEGKTPNA